MDYEEEPGEVEKAVHIGRRIQGVRQEIWDEVCRCIMAEGDSRALARRRKIKSTCKADTVAWCKSEGNTGSGIHERGV